MALWLFFFWIVWVICEKPIPGTDLTLYRRKFLVIFSFCEKFCVNWQHCYSHTPLVNFPLYLCQTSSLSLVGVDGDGSPELRRRVRCVLATAPGFSDSGRGFVRERSEPMYLHPRSNCYMLMTDIKRSNERQVYSLRYSRSPSSPKRIAIPPRLATHVPRVAVTPFIALPESPVSPILAGDWVSPARPFPDPVQSPPASMWRLARPPLHYC
jgi:hypothetical protein